jgi:hypothetical protein
MKKHLLPLCFLLALLVVIFPASAQSDIPQTPQGNAFSTRFTYQGQIKDSSGNPITNTCDFSFRLWDALTAGNQIGGESLVTAVAVTDGNFAALVNTASEFGANAFVGAPRWLEIGVRCPAGTGEYTPLAPRQALTVTPLASYAFSSSRADNTPWTGISSVPLGFADGVDNDTTYAAGNGLTLSANQFSVNFGGNGAANTAARSDHIHTNYWRINGNSQTDPAANFIGTTDDTPLVFKVNNQTALRLEPNATSPNIIIGSSSNTVASGIHGATIGGGGVSGIESNQVTGNYGTVSGGRANASTGYDSTVGGGYFNTAGSEATVGGGHGNTASGMYSTIPGGDRAVASHYGEMAYASGFFSAPGDAQASFYVLRETSVNDTWINLYLDGSDEWISIPAGRTVAFDILVVGRSTLLSAAYQIRGVIENTNGVVNFIGTPAVTVLGEDSASWDAAVVAGDVFDVLAVQVKGATAGTSVRWVASVRTVEVAAP